MFHLYRYRRKSADTTVVRLRITSSPRTKRPPTPASPRRQLLAALETRPQRRCGPRLAFRRIREGFSWHTVRKLITLLSCSRIISYCNKPVTYLLLKETRAHRVTFHRCQNFAVSRQSRHGAARPRQVPRISKSAPASPEGVCECFFVCSRAFVCGWARGIVCNRGEQTANLIILHAL